MKNCSLPNKDNVYDILFAPNAFKGSLKADEFCRILTDEFSDLPLCTAAFPMCDGGDDSAEIISSYTGGTAVPVWTRDALGRAHTAVYYINGNTAIIDLASQCGLKSLSPDEYDVMNADTRGLGIAICDALEKGCRKIILGLGGSASIDGGIGALEEMGLNVVNSSPVYQNHLIHIEQIQADVLKEKFKHTEFLLLCDVENTLCGHEGAAQVFGPQKGASAGQVTLLEKELLQYAKQAGILTQVDLTTLKYGGTAGGTAASFAAFLNARLVSGADYCLQPSRFENYLPTAKLVITGEGKLDQQTLCGKLPGTIASRCQLHHIPVIAIAGVSDISSSPFRQVYQLIDYAENVPASIRQPGFYLRKVAKEIKKNLLNLI